MMLTSVDWSGDAGSHSDGPNQPGFLALAFVSIEEEYLEVLGAALGEVRARNSFQPDHVFEHLKSTEAVKRDFCRALSTSEIQVRVLLVDKSRDWPESVWKLKGNERLVHCLAEGSGRLPAVVVNRQTLLLDLDQKKDGKFATQIIKAVHRSTRGVEKPGFRRIKCCPDSDPTLGDIVQVADMVAGAVRRSRTTSPSDQPELRRLILPL